MVRGAWRATVHGVAKSRTQLSNFTFTFTGGLDGKESAFKVGDLGSIPGLGRSPSRAWQHTPVFLPGEFHGQRSLVSCSPQGHKESDMTEVT